MDNANLEVEGVIIPVLVRKPAAPTTPNNGSDSIKLTAVESDCKHEKRFTSLSSSRSSPASASPRVNPERTGFDRRAENSTAIELGTVSEASTNASSLPRSSNKVHPQNERLNTSNSRLESSANISGSSGIGIVKQFAFSSQLQRSSVLAVHLRDSRPAGAPTLYAKGAPEMIAKLSRPESRSYF